MSTPITFASTELPYPVYEAEFDPYDRGYLLISGGGGESKSGVPNRLSLIDVSSRAIIEPVGEINLPTSEDYVASTASLATKDGLTTLSNSSAGIDLRQKGRNNHLRPVNVSFPSRTKAQQARLDETEKQGLKDKAQLEELPKTQLLSSLAVTGKYAFQTPIRLSRVRSRDVNNKRVGAVASKDADASEIAIFDATSLPVDASRVIRRIKPDGGQDAEDLDIEESEPGSFGLAYCTSSAAFVQQFQYGFKPNSYKDIGDGAFRIHSVGASQRQQKLRIVRWLSDKHVLVLSTNNQTKSAELFVVYADQAKREGKVVRRQPLPKSMRSCTALDVCRLDADPGTGVNQVVVAVGGSDGSIQIYTVENDPSTNNPWRQIGPFKSFSNLSRVHDNSVCKLAFSRFYSPRQAADSPVSIATTKQYIRLASLGIMSRKAVVESLTLTSVPTSPSATSDVDDKPSTPSVRWVLSSSSAEGMFSWAYLVLIGLVVLVTAVLTQRMRQLGGGDALAPLRSLQELQKPGAVPPKDRKPSHSTEQDEPSVSVPSSEDDAVRQVAEAVEKAEQAVPPEVDTEKDAKVKTLKELVQEHGAPSDSGAGSDEQAGVQKIVLVSPHEEDEDQANIAVREAGHEALEGAKQFADLTEEQQHLWRERLKRTGHWVEEEGLAVLKGVFFSEFAVEVGGGIRDALLNS